MVISQEMVEKEMGYRGSKSTHNIVYYTGTATINNNVLGVVKEQRLDGGCIGATCTEKITVPMLRYNLMGLERGYQVKFLSNQTNFMNLRGYSTYCTLNPQIQESSPHIQRIRGAESPRLNP